jgi:2,4-dienoyl-CoA reductase (NADPH2)
MGSEGYLLNQFLCARTNERTDGYGGSHRKPHAPRRSRSSSASAARCGRDFIVMYRHSLMDLVEGGNTWDEVAHVARALEAAGVSIINTGIGWHEARVPTIVTSVPRAAFAELSRAPEARGARAGGGIEPHQHARRGRGHAGATATPTWCRWRGPSWPMPSS